MRSVLFIWLFLCVGCTEKTQEQVLPLDTRILPVPAGASEELQDVIRLSPQPDIAGRQDVPASDAEWLERFRAQDERNGAQFRSLIERLPVSVTYAEIGGVKVQRIMPDKIEAAHKQRLFVYLHGGAYVFGSGDAGIREALLIATRIGIPVISIDYRLPPNHPFPAAIDDVVSVYRVLLETRPAKSIAIGGQSSGGGLTLASVHRFKTLDLALPGAVFAGTPWADLTETGDSLFINEGLDQNVVTYSGTLAASGRLYAGDHDIRDPLISPVYGDFSDFPPTMLVTGTRDLFLSHVVRTHRKLRAAQVTADLHVYEGLSHADYALKPELPESIDVYNELKVFLAKHLE